MPIRARHESEKQLVLSKISFPYWAQGILLSPCDIWIGRLDTLWSFLIQAYGRLTNGHQAMTYSTWISSHTSQCKRLIVKLNSRRRGEEVSEIHELMSR